MNNYINISPQEVEEGKSQEVARFGSYELAKCAAKSFKRGAEFATTKANVQLTPILDEALRVMEQSIEVNKYAMKQFLHHALTSIKLRDSISDLEQSINNIKALKG